MLDLVKTSSFPPRTVDILFALVVGEALDAALRSGDMSAPGRMHLAFAAVLVTTSWIGYHTSRHRGHGEMRFGAGGVVPILKLVVDIALVVAYWFAVKTVENGAEGASDEPSLWPESAIALAAFGLYLT